MTEELQEKIDYSINLIRKAESLALSFSEEGFHLAFSGGKDSLVLYKLTEMAGVKFKAYMNITTLDPPELLKFIRKHYPDVKFLHPQTNFYNLIKQKKMLPLMHARYCCAYLKEQAGAGTVTLLGIRKKESVRRSKREECEITNHKYSNTFDQFNIDNEKQHICLKGKDKIMLSPIINWSESDVWEFIHDNKMEYCELYDQGYTRIGCIFCPMSSVKSKLRDRQRYPGVERAIKKSIQYLIDNYNFVNKYTTNADEIFDWWISNESADKYFAKHPPVSSVLT